MFFASKIIALKFIGWIIFLLQITCEKPWNQCVLLCNCLSLQVINSSSKQFQRCINECKYCFNKKRLILKLFRHNSHTETYIVKWILSSFFSFSMLCIISFTLTGKGLFHLHKLYKSTSPNVYKTSVFSMDILLN